MSIFLGKYYLNNQQWGSKSECVKNFVIVMTEAECLQNIICTNATLMHALRVYWVWEARLVQEGQSGCLYALIDMRQ